MFELKKRGHVIISGRVQGVYFRSHTRNKALELGLSGWVSNLDDGRVEAVFEGDKIAVKQMIEWCHVGEGYASVDEVEEIVEDYKGEFSGFKVRY